MRWEHLQTWLAFGVSGGLVRVQGFQFRGFVVQGLGFRVEGLVFWVLSSRRCLQTISVSEMEKRVQPANDMRSVDVSYLAINQSLRLRVRVLGSGSRV